MATISDPNAPGGANNPISLSRARELYGTDAGVNVSGTYASGGAPIYGGVGGSGSGEVTTVTVRDPITGVSGTGSSASEAKKNQEKQYEINRKIDRPYSQFDTRPVTYQKVIVEPDKRGIQARNVNSSNPVIGGGLGVPSGAVPNMGVVQQAIPLKGGIVERNVREERTAQDFRGGGTERVVIGYKRNAKGGTEEITEERIKPSETKSFVNKTLFFYKANSGELFALPASVVGKKSLVEGRLQAAEKNAPLTSSSVGRVLLASGLGGSGNVAIFKEEEKTEPVTNTNTPVSEANKFAQPRIRFTATDSNARIDIRTGEVTRPVKELSGAEQARIIFAEGRTSLEPAFAKTAQQVREANKDVPVVGDVGAAFVGLIGGAAKGAETVLRSPITALKAVNEKVTTGRVSKETGIEAYGGLASASELLPTSLIVNPEVAVAKQMEGKSLFEAQKQAVRSPEELKQAGIAVLVAGLAGKSFSKGIESVAAKPINVKQGGTVLITEGKITPTGETARGTFESKSIAKTSFGQEVRGESGGTFKSVGTEKGIVSSSKGVTRVSGESVPVGSFAVSKSPAEGVFVGVEKSFVGIGEGGKIVGSVSKGRTLAATKGSEFQGGLGGKSPVGGSLDTVRQVFVSKSKASIGVPSEGSTFFVDTRGSVIDTRGGGLPNKFYEVPARPVNFPSSGSGVTVIGDRVGVNQLIVQKGFTKTAVEGVIPKSEPAIVSAKAMELQAGTGEAIIQGSKSISAPKGLVQESIVFEPISKEVSRSYQLSVPRTNVVFEPKTKSIRGTTAAVVFEPEVRSAVSEKQVNVSRQVERVSRQDLLPERKTSLDTLKVLKQVTSSTAREQARSTSFSKSVPSNVVSEELFKRNGGGLGGGSPSNGFDVGRGRSVKLRGVSVKQKSGLFPSLISITRQQQRSGRFGYRAPSKALIKRSAIYRRSGGEVVPVGEQLKEKSFGFKRFLFGKNKAQAALFNLGMLLILFLFFVYSGAAQLVAVNLFVASGDVTTIAVISFFSFFLFASIALSLVANRSGA